MSGPYFLLSLFLYIALLSSDYLSVTASLLVCASTARGFQRFVSAMAIPLPRKITDMSQVFSNTGSGTNNALLITKSFITKSQACNYVT